MNKILQYQSILQNRRSIVIQPVELFSARMYSDQVIFQYKLACMPLKAFTSKNRKLVIWQFLNNHTDFGVWSLRTVLWPQLKYE